MLAACCALAALVPAALVGVHVVPTSHGVTSHGPATLSRPRAVVAPSMTAQVQSSSSSSSSSRQPHQHGKQQHGQARAPKPVEVVIAGGGIGGLCTALVLLKMGYQVRVFEKTSEYRPFGGPIQIASNAAESFRRIDEDCYDRILAESTVSTPRRRLVLSG